MANTIGTVSIDFEARLAKFESDVGRATRAMQRDVRRLERSVSRDLEKINSRAEKFGKDLRRSVGGALGIVAGGALVRGLANLSDEFVNVESKIALANGTSSKYNATLRDLFDIAQETFVSLDATATLFQRLARSTQETDLTQKDLLLTIETINKSFAVSGSTVQESRAAIIQFSQAMAAGALRGEEFRSVNEQAPRLIEAIAKGAGIAREELKNFAEEGLLTRDLVLPAILNSSRGIAQEFEQLPLNFERALARLENSFAVAVGRFNQQSGLLEIISGDLVGGLEQTFDSLALSINNLQDSGFFNALGASIQLTVDLLDEIIILIGARFVASMTAGRVAALLFSSGVKGIGLASLFSANGIKALNAAMLKNPAGLIASGIALATLALVKLGEESRKAERATRDFFAEFGESEASLTNDRAFRERITEEQRLRSLLSEQTQRLANLMRQQRELSDGAEGTFGTALAEGLAVLEPEIRRTENALANLVARLAEVNQANELAIKVEQIESALKQARSAFDQFALRDFPGVDEGAALDALRARIISLRQELAGLNGTDFDGALGTLSAAALESVKSFEALEQKAREQTFVLQANASAAQEAEIAQLDFAEAQAISSIAAAEGTLQFVVEAERIRESAEAAREAVKEKLALERVAEDQKKAQEALNETIKDASELVRKFGTDQQKLAQVEADRVADIERLKDAQIELSKQGISLADAIAAVNARANEQKEAITGAEAAAKAFEDQVNALIDPVSQTEKEIQLLNTALANALLAFDFGRADQIADALARIAGAGGEAAGAFDGLAQSLSRDIGNALANGRGLGSAIGAGLTNFGLQGFTESLQEGFQAAFDAIDVGDDFARDVAFALGRGLTVGAEQGIGVGAIAGISSIFGDQLGDALADALGESLGDIAGPLGEVAGKIAGDLIFSSIVKAFTKAPRISVSGDSDVDRFSLNDVESLQTDLGEVFLGLRKIPPEIADQIKRAIQETDKSIAIAIEGASNLDAINAALAQFDSQAKAKKFSAAELIEARFDAVLGAFDSFTQNIVNQASLLEDRIQRLNDVIDIGTRVALGDTLGLTGAGFIGASPAPIAPAPVGPPGGGVGPGGFDRQLRLQSEELAKFNAVIQGTGDVAEVSSPALQQTIAIVDELGRTGETLADTFDRLLESTAALDTLAGLLDFQFADSRDGVVRFGDALTRAFGDDLERLQSGLETIFDRFFGDEEVLQNQADMAQQRAAELFGSLGIEITDALFTQSGFREAFEEFSQIFTAEQLAILIEAGVAVDAMLDAEESLSEARSSAAQQALEDARAELERTESLRDGINDLLGIEETQIDSINERADALLDLAQSEAELLEVEFARQQALLAFAAELEASIASLTEQLFGTSEAAFGLTGSIGSLGNSFRDLSGIADNLRDTIRQIQGVQGRSTLDPIGQRDFLQAQFDAAIAGGDFETANQIALNLVDAIRTVGSSSSDADQRVLAIIADLEAAALQAGSSSPPTGAQVGSIQRSAAQIEAQAFEQVRLASQLIQELGLLASITGENGLELAERFGVPLDRLVDLIGVDLVNLTADQTGILGTLAEDFGVTIAELESALGISLGSLADATSLLNDGLEQAINGLPPEIAGPLLDALAEVEQTGDVSGLESLISDLSPALRNELAPFFDEIDVTDQADAQVDELVKINTGIRDMVVGLERVADNLAAQNANLGLPQFARGGIATSPSIFGEGGQPEAAVPLPDGRSIPVTLRGGTSSRQTESLLERMTQQNDRAAELLRRIEQAVNTTGHAQAQELARSNRIRESQRV